jgi:N6-L-threonylcarbamoyladenine synthase
VGANLALRASLNQLCVKHNAQLYFPRQEFCTDNGAMIAYAGCQRLLAGERDDLTVKVRARWPLCELTLLRE